MCSFTKKSSASGGLRPPDPQSSFMSLPIILWDRRRCFIVFAPQHGGETAGIDMQWKTCFHPMCYKLMSFCCVNCISWIRTHCVWRSLPITFPLFFPVPFPFLVVLLYFPFLPNLSFPIHLIFPSFPSPSLFDFSSFAILGWMSMLCCRFCGVSAIPVAVLVFLCISDQNPPVTRHSIHTKLRPWCAIHDEYLLVYLLVYITEQNLVRISTVRNTHHSP